MRKRNIINTIAFILIFGLFTIWVMSTFNGGDNIEKTLTYKIQERDIELTLLGGEIDVLTTKRDKLEIKQAEDKIALLKYQMRDSFKNDSLSKEQYTEMRSKLDDLEIKVYGEVTCYYDVPYDMFYTFLACEDVYVSQTYYEHIANNKLGAVDVATNKKPLIQLAPDLYNTEVEWRVQHTKYSSSTGKTIELVTNTHKVLIGHVKEYLVQTGDTVKTGEPIIVTGGDKADEGISTGLHAHIEYYKWDEIKEDWVIFEYILGESNRHALWESNLQQGKENANNNLWIISTYYSPVEGQSSYYQGDYTKDFTMNCMGSCRNTASGLELSQADKYQVVACPKEFPLGTKFQITLPVDHPEWPSKSWQVTCEDRGGAIRMSDTNSKGQNQLDLWAGYGIEGEPHPWIGEMSTKKAIVQIIS